MIVYGDPHYREALSNLVAGLQARIAAASLERQDAQNPSLEELRTLLILAGQLEQAAHDGLPDIAPQEEAEQGQQIARLHSVTAHIADAFYAAWASELPETDRQPDVADSLNRASRILDTVNVTGDQILTVKIPEGFAFYALFPEQYCASALRWLEDHAGEREKRATVVGIRSIGTTLGAVVAATLKVHGWQVASLTVRPSGHPFERYVDIERRQIEGAKWALVVDEGPGLSGSSMAAVGNALVRAGLPKNRISFFPGHEGEPGSAASEQVRAWWATAPRYATPLEQIQFEVRALPEALATWLASTTGYEGSAIQIADVSGGLWRELVYDSPAKWPAVYAPFERPKYLCTLPDGRRILLKFEGLCEAPGGRWTLAEAAGKLLQGRGRHTLGTHHGYCAVTWIDGKPLTRRDLDDDMLRYMGRYIAQVGGHALAYSEQQAGLERLTHMLYWNTWEALGEEAAGRMRLLSEKMAALPPRRPLPCYGDGRMSPHEWIRTPSGEIAKVSSVGHALDHTCIGAQPVAWDVAGAIVEWGLEDTQTATLLDVFYSAGGALIEPDALTFYRMAYAAFHMGQCHMCANMQAHDPQEQTRLWAAYARYKGLGVSEEFSF